MISVDFAHAPIRHICYINAYTVELEIVAAGFYWYNCIQPPGCIRMFTVQ